MKKEILRMQDVSIGAESLYALENFHLHVCEGEVVNIMGLSGSGKTTIYEYFMGHVPLKHGKVIYNGVTSGEGTDFKSVGDVVCIGQNSTLIPGLSVAENIFIITRKRKVKTIVNMKTINYRAKMLLGQYAPEISPEKLVSQLTPVECRIVEILRAIENEVKLVVIDDVFQGFGQNDTLRLKELLLLLKEKKIAVLYMCHGLDFVQAYTDKMIILRKGRVVRTFFGWDFDSDLCNKLLIGNEELPYFKRSAAKKEKEILRIQDLSGSSYVKDLCLRIHSGEIVGFYDLNNQGNMELLSMIIGEKTPKSGAIYLDGRRFESKNLDYAIKKGIGYIPKTAEDYGLVGTMDVSDNLCLPILKKTGYGGFFKNNKLANYVMNTYTQKLGVEANERRRKVDYFDRYIQLSTMMQRWILFRPSVMVCMEPCLNADMIMRDIIFKALDEMAGNGTAVLIASQNMNELKMVCDTVYVFSSVSGQSVVRYDKSEF